MQYKKISDNATSRTYRHTFKAHSGLTAMKLAQRASYAILGYFRGTYVPLPIETTIEGGNERAVLVVSYIEDRNLTEVLDTIAIGIQPNPDHWYKDQGKA